MNVLVTGGLGFIGSHTTIELLKAGHRVTIIDNLSNSKSRILQRLERLSGKNITFYKSDIRDTDHLATIIKDNHIASVLHFAALKAVGESGQKPLEYYENNIIGLLSVLRAMDTTGVTSLVFSSSCTVYGEPDFVPIDEETQLKPTTNPYGETKQMAERIIQDVCKASSLKAILLRYFNPIGAHPSGEIGELPNGTPNCVLPYITQCTAGLREPLTVFGDDYPTPDGTGIRDYIHVVRLANAHVKALDYLPQQEEKTSIFNIGTGKGTSVLELITTFEKVTGEKVPYVIGKRREGDVPEIFASANKANKLLGWEAEKTLEEALQDAWRWQQQLAKSPEKDD